MSLPAWMHVLLFLVPVTILFGLFFPDVFRKKNKEEDNSSDVDILKKKIALLNNLKEWLPDLIKHSVFTKGEFRYDNVDGFTIDLHALKIASEGHRYPSLSWDYMNRMSKAKLKQFIIPNEVSKRLSPEEEAAFLSLMKEVLGDGYDNWGMLEIWASHPKRKESDYKRIFDIADRCLDEKINAVFDNQASDVTESRLKALEDLLGITEEKVVNENLKNQLLHEMDEIEPFPSRRRSASSRR